MMQTTGNRRRSNTPNRLMDGSARAIAYAKPMTRTHVMVNGFCCLCTGIWGLLVPTTCRTARHPRKD